MKRYLMHECADDRYLPPLEVVAASDHDIVVNGLQSLIASLRHELTELGNELAGTREAFSTLRKERDGLIQGISEPGPGPLPIGMRRNGAVIIRYGSGPGSYTVRCTCGSDFNRGRTALMKSPIWRCYKCVQR